MDADFAMFNSYLNNKKEEGVFAKFYDKVERTGKILDNGMPEFRTRTYVEIRVRNSYDVADRAADEMDIRRFPAEYQIYQVKRKKMEEGTPLKQFAFLSPAQIEACDFRGIYTVEELANLDADRAKSINLSEEVGLAKKFLEVSKNNQIISEYQKKIEELENKVKSLEERLKE